MTKISTGLEFDQFDADTTFIAWANILRNNGYHKMHTHPGSAWSGVYYIQTGSEDASPEGPDDAGKIEFFDPRMAVEIELVPRNPFGQWLTFLPETGRIYCFPAWLRHMVIRIRAVANVSPLPTTYGLKILIKRWRSMF